MSGIMNIFLLAIGLIGFSYGIKAKDLQTNFFGYLEGRWEKVGKVPERSGSTSTTAGSVTKTKQPNEISVPNVKVMMKSSYRNRYSGFINLRGDDGEGVSVKNAWVEAKIYQDYFKFRIGKMYSPFGLYNEQLDATPTYIGIEPPEPFDGDHLLLPRTTNALLHGELNIFNGLFRYSLTTGNDERYAEAVPVGFDVRYTFFGKNFDITPGFSYYHSGLSKPSVAMGDGSPNAGVANWMESDSYHVYGPYTEVNMGNLQFQVAFFFSSHEAKRSGTKVQSLASDTTLNAQQIARICGGNCATASDSLTAYDIRTWYVRLGYTMSTKAGDFIPYVQWDYYKNPETIKNKTYGGDNEAGLADDGEFTKQTLGLVYRPYDVLAFKFDASNHNQKIDGRSQNYMEGRFSYSYIWHL